MPRGDPLLRAGGSPRRTRRGRTRRYPPLPRVRRARQPLPDAAGRLTQLGTGPDVSVDAPRDVPLAVWKATTMVSPAGNLCALTVTEPSCDLPDCTPIRCSGVTGTRAVLESAAHSVAGSAGLGLSCPAVCKPSGARPLAPLPLKRQTASTRGPSGPAKLGTPGRAVKHACGQGCGERGEQAACCCGKLCTRL